MFRVATYNIRNSIGLDSRRRPDRILDVVEELDPDILALQEVDRWFGYGWSALPSELISARTDYRVVPIADHRFGVGWHGNAILVRKSIRIVDQKRLDMVMLEPRGAIMAELELSGLPVRIFAMNLSLMGMFRERQIQCLMTQVAAEPDPAPTVALGDLNEWRQSANCLQLFQPRYRIISPGNSYPAINPMDSLDRVVISPELTLHRSGVHHSKKAHVASDHLPVWADLSFAD